MKTEKMLNIVLGVIMVLSAFLVISLIANISDDSTDPGMNSWLNTNLTWLYFLLIITIGIVLLFSIVHTLGDKAAAKRGLITLGCGVAVLLISYLLSSNELPKFYGVQRFIDEGTLTISVSKRIDTLLIVTYILVGLSVGATMFWSVARVFKK
jgi:small-conductance mechanosensitive channel